jgi:hypothetical protein
MIVRDVHYRSRPSSKLTEKDTLVVADLTNSTGDAVFDDARKQGLRVQPEQSPSSIYSPIRGWLG